MMGNFTKNTLITFLTRVATAFFTVVITAVIARVLGPEGQGIYSLAIFFPVILLIFTDFGINPASMFFIGQGRYSPREVFGNNIIFNAGISIFTIFIGIVIILFFGWKFFPGVDKEYLFLVLPLIPLTLFFELGCRVLLGLQKIRKYNLISFVQGFIFLVLILVLLLWLRFGIVAAIFAQISTFFIVTIGIFLVALRETGGVSLKFNKKYCRESFRYGIKNQLGSVFHFFHHRIDLFMLNLFINPIAVGFYYAAARLAEGVWFLSAAAGTVLFPQVASEKNEKNLKEFTPRVYRNILFINSILVIGLFLLSKYLIVLFYSEKFLDSIRPFQILLIGTLAMSVCTILMNDLAARGKPMISTYLIGFSAILNIILNILWIPKWGIGGAAWATAVSYSLASVIIIFIYGRVSGNKIRDIILFQKSDIQLYKSLLKRKKL